MNQNICATLIKAIEEIVGINFNHNQELLLLPQTIDPYASDEEIGDDDTGLGENLDQPAEITGKVELHQKKWRDEPLRMTRLTRKNLEILLKVFFNS